MSGGFGGGAVRIMARWCALVALAEELEFSSQYPHGS